MLNPWVIVICILAAIAVIIAVRCIYELHCITSVQYDLRSEKISPRHGVRAVFISDLHARQYGKENCRLVSMISDAHPDVILIGGDLNISKKKSSDRKALEFLEKIKEIAPVYYAPGNHEKGVEYLKMFESRNRVYHEALREFGICYLSNTSVKLNDDITVTGLDVDYSFYSKTHPKKLETEKAAEYIGKSDEKSYNILLAHNPGFFESCIPLGYDLCLSGHYHGGAVRLPKIGGVISPQFRLFPKYSRGRFEKDGSTLIVSAGCGSHTVNLRLFNKPEILVLDIRSSSVF